MHSFAIVIATLSLVLHKVTGHGKEGPSAPHLPPSALASLRSTEAPLSTFPNKVLTCLPGYALVDGLCVKDIDEPAALACLGGDLVNGQCEIEIEYLFTCPPGYKNAGDRCTNIIEVGPQFYCPVGYYDDGNACAQSIAAETDLQCDIGELVGDKCILKERSEYIIKSACPEGSELHKDGNCWKEVDTFDCTEKVEETVTVLASSQQKSHTPLGKKVIVSKGKSGGKFRHLIGKEPAVRTTPPPPPPPPTVTGIGKEMVAVTAPLPTKINVVSQVCSKKVQVDALALISCAPGYVDGGGHCIKETLRNPITICTNGTMKEGVCLPTVKRVPKHPGCPKGAYSARGKCWKEDELLPINSCPPTFTDTGSNCLGVVEEPGFSCPVGLELIGDRCFGQIVRPPISFPTKADVSGGKKY